MDVLSPEHLIRIFLVFVRCGALLASAPVFGHRAVPVRLRIFFAVLLAYTTAGIIPHDLPPGATQPLGLFVAVAREALTGLTLGFTAQFIFWSVQLAGEFIGFQIGLSMAQAFDPSTSDTSNPMSRLLGMVLLLVFLLLDGHHYVIQGLVGSFEVVPLAGADLSGPGPLMLRWAGEMFVTALRLAAPFMVTLFLADLALGVLARVLPQADLFGLSLPFKLLVGLGVGYFFLETFLVFARPLLDGVLRNMLSMLEALA